MTTAFIRLWDRLQLRSHREISKHLSEKSFRLRYHFSPLLKRRLKNMAHLGSSLSCLCLFSQLPASQLPFLFLSISHWQQIAEIKITVVITLYAPAPVSACSVAGASPLSSSLFLLLVSWSISAAATVQPPAEPGNRVGVQLHVAAIRFSEC